MMMIIIKWIFKKFLKKLKNFFCYNDEVLNNIEKILENQRNDIINNNNI